MACLLCRGTLVPIEVPTAETAFQCMSCGSVDTAENMMARALRKAVRVETDDPEPQSVVPASGGASEKDRDAVLRFLASLDTKD
jgi:hypothetical protein